MGRTYRTSSCTPVVHQPTRTAVNVHDNLQERICLFAGVIEQRRTTTMLWICFCTVEGVGSNPSAPLLNFLQTKKKLKILVVTQRAPCSNRAATRVNLLSCWKIDRAKNDHLRRTYTLRRFSGLRTSRGASTWLVLHTQPSSASQSSPASSPSPRHPATPQTAPQETSSHPRPPGIQWTLPH